MIIKSDSTDSVVKFEINGVPLLSINTQKNNSASIVKYQKGLLKYNGLYWEVYKTPVATNESNYYYSNDGAQISTSYAAKINLGACTRLIIRPNTRYNLISGSIKIYAR